MLTEMQNPASPPSKLDSDKVAKTVADGRKLEYEMASLGFCNPLPLDPHRSLLRATLDYLLDTLIEVRDTH